VRTVDFELFPDAPMIAPTMNSAVPIAIATQWALIQVTLTALLVL